MIIETVKFAKEFSVLGSGEWITIGGTLEAGEDPIEAIKELKLKMISMYGVDKEREGWVMNHDSYSPPLDQPPVKETRLQSIVESIKSCKDVKVLESYRLIAKAEKELQVIYDETYKKITA